MHIDIQWNFRILLIWFITGLVFPDVKDFQDIWQNNSTKTKAKRKVLLCETYLAVIKLEPTLNVREKAKNEIKNLNSNILSTPAELDHKAN